jgi:DNA polymerase
MNSEIEIIKKRVTECTNCELCKTRTQSVPGKGDIHSDVMFIGEAPGKNEDRTGEPFVGIAGQRLSIALEGAGISRESIYITNVVKCRPPNNRVPTIDERDSCKIYLQEEIAIIKPKVICILGNTAFNSILGGSEITKYRGKIVKKGRQFYFLTVHPAATIYNQELINTLKEDIVKLFDIIKELKNGKQILADIEYPT